MTSPEAFASDPDEAPPGGYTGKVVSGGAWNLLGTTKGAGLNVLHAAGRRRDMSHVARSHG